MQNEWLVNLSKSASWKLQKHSLTARRQLGNTFMSVYQILCSISKINEHTLVVDFMNLTLCYKGHLHWERLWRKHCWPKWNENVLVFHSGKTYLASKLYEGLLRSGIWKYLKREKLFSLKLFMGFLKLFHNLQSCQIWVFRRSTVHERSLERKIPFCSHQCH